MNARNLIFGGDGFLLIVLRGVADHIQLLNDVKAVRLVYYMNLIHLHHVGKFVVALGLEVGKVNLIDSTGAVEEH